MSEVEALLGLYGAIDRAVVAGEVDSASLAPLLGAYRDDAATGWYDDHYVPWVAALKARAALRARPVRPRGGDAEKPVAPAPPPDAVPRRRRRTDLSPRAEEIREALTAFPSVPVESRTAARRLLAITVAAHAMPQVFGSDGSHADAARAALVFRRTDVDPDSGVAEELAARLHVRLAEDFTSMSRWAQVVEDAVADGLLPVSFRSQAIAPPCTGRLILRSDPNDPDPDPCTVLEAELVTDQLSFEDAKKYLEPENWQFEGSFWCRMEKDPAALGPNSWLYHETVATSCPPAPGGWTVSTDLQFWFSHPTPSEARAEYDLAPGLPGPLSDIEVDEGSLRVIDLGDGRINLKTTKRVRFAGSFDGAGLAMFMCATGYSTILEDLVLSVGSTPASSSHPFPVQAPPGGPVNDPTSAAKKNPPGPGSQPPPNPGTQAGADSLDAIAEDAAELVGAYLKDVTATSAASLASIQAGTYKVENAWADGIKMWSTYLSGVGKAVELGTRTAKVVAKKTTDES